MPTEAVSSTDSDCRYWRSRSVDAQKFHPDCQLCVLPCRQPSFAIQHVSAEGLRCSASQDLLVVGLHGMPRVPSCLQVARPERRKQPLRRPCLSHRSGHVGECTGPTSKGPAPGGRSESSSNKLKIDYIDLWFMYCFMMLVWKEQDWTGHVFIELQKETSRPAALKTTFQSRFRILCIHEESSHGSGRATVPFAYDWILCDCTVKLSRWAGPVPKPGLWAKALSQ